MYDDMKKKTFLVDRQPRYLDIAVKILYGLSTCQNYLYYSQTKLLAVNDKVPTSENWLGIKTLAQALKNVRLRIQGTVFP